MLTATNTLSLGLEVALWPVGFVTNLGPKGGPRDHDWRGTLMPEETKVVRVTVQPTTDAEGDYLIGMAALTDPGNSLGLQPARVE